MNNLTLPQPPVIPRPREESGAGSYPLSPCHSEAPRGIWWGVGSPLP